MKRLNPKTNQPFKRGDIREDGKVFFNYTNLVKADGYFTERWISAESSEKAKKADLANKNAKYAKKTDRMPNKFASKICKNNKETIAGFKSIWRIKIEGASEEVLKSELEAYPELYDFFFPQDK